MKISALGIAILVSTVVLGGCGGSTSASHAPVVVPQSAATPRALQAAGMERSRLTMKTVKVDPTARGTRGDYGGTPAFDGDVDLYDAPLAGFSQVNVALTEVDAISANGAITPMQVYATPNVVNLLGLQTSSLAINQQLPGGMYVGIRLVGSVSKSSAVTSGGVTMPISVSNAVGDVFSLPVAASFGSTNGAPAEVAIDFNLAESIASDVVDGTTGSPMGQTLSLTPTAVANPSAGSISGSVSSLGGSVVSNATIVVVDTNGNVVNTTVSAADGTFNVHALPYGTYQVEVFNAYTNAFGGVFLGLGFDGAWGSAYYGPVVNVAGPSTNVGGIWD